VVYTEAQAALSIGAANSLQDFSAKKLGLLERKKISFLV
jgi:hypothetical protein